MSRDDIAQGTEKGVVFIGDSWHAMPIFGGEGGNHAILDSIELANVLADEEKNLKQAVAAYYNGAWRRCQEAVKRSRQRFYLLHRPIAEWREMAGKMRSQ